MDAYWRKEATGSGTGQGRGESGAQSGGRLRGRFYAVPGGRAGGRRVVCVEWAGATQAGRQGMSAVGETHYA